MRLMVKATSLMRCWMVMKTAGNFKIFCACSRRTDLKKHAKVMFVKNNFDMGYINGSLGEVIGFEEDDEHGLLPKVQLSDGSVLLVNQKLGQLKMMQVRRLPVFSKFHCVWHGQLPFIKAGHDLGSCGN